MIVTIKYRESTKAPEYTAVIKDGRWYANYNRPQTIDIQIGKTVDVNALLISDWGKAVGAHIVPNTIVMDEPDTLIAD
jgi:hypothetical protein